MKQIAILLLVSVALASCGISKEEHTALQEKYEVLSSEMEQQAELLVQVDGQMDSIGTLMDSIEVIEEDILIDLERGLRYDDYLARLRSIQQYMERTNMELEQLEQAVAKSENQNRFYEKMISSYRKMLKEKDQTIEQLQTRVEQMQVEKDALVKTVDLQNDEIQVLQDEVERRQQELAQMEAELISSKGENIKVKAEKYFELAQSTEMLGDKTSGLFSGKRKKAYYRQAWAYYKQAFEMDADLDTAYKKMEELNARL